MDIEEYFEKLKRMVKDSSRKQKLIFAVIFLIILVGIIFVYNPSKKLLEMRNSQRRNDVVSILNAVYKYGVDHEGNFPFQTPSSATMICRSGAKSCEGLVDISKILEEQQLLLKVPVDPRVNNDNASGYQISWLSNGRISVSAPLAENNAVISLSK
jgi:hypothetical protein